MKKSYCPDKYTDSIKWICLNCSPKSIQLYIQYYGVYVDLNKKHTMNFATYVRLLCILLLRLLCCVDGKIIPTGTLRSQLYSVGHRLQTSHLWLLFYSKYCNCTWKKKKKITNSSEHAVTRQEHPQMLFYTRRPRDHLLSLPSPYNNFNHKTLPFSQHWQLHSVLEVNI